MDGVGVDFHTPHLRTGSRRYPVVRQAFGCHPYQYYIVFDQLRVEIVHDDFPVGDGGESSRRACIAYAHTCGAADGNVAVKHVQRPIFDSVVIGVLNRIEGMEYGQGEGGIPLFFSVPYHQWQASHLLVGVGEHVGVAYCRGSLVQLRGWPEDFFKDFLAPA